MFKVQSSKFNSGFDDKTAFTIDVWAKAPEICKQVSTS